MTEQPDQAGRPDDPGRPETAEPVVRRDEPGAGSPPTRPIPRRPVRHPGRWLLAGVLVVLVAAGLVVTGWLGWQLLETLRQDPARATVGDCLSGADDPGELRRVSCDAGDATWQVAATEPGLTWSDFQALPDEHLCAGHPDTELAVWYGDDRDAGPGDVFCLEPLD